MSIKAIAVAILISALLALAFALDASTAHAQGCMDSTCSPCNQFETVQSVILSEATRQPFAAQLEIARVFVTKADESGDPCFLSPQFYTGYAVALRAQQRGDFSNHHWRAYFDLYSFDSAVREPAALAAHIALTEEPPVRRFHFDNWGSQASFWQSPRACPNIFKWRTVTYPDGISEYIPIRSIVIGQVRIC